MRQTRTPAGGRIRSRRRRAVAAIMGTVALAVLVVGSMSPSAPASAVDEYGFPTWAEVEAARGNEASKNAQIETIRGLIAQLETELADAQALADQRAGEAIEAQRKYDEAVAVADTLQEQADEASAAAAESKEAAGQLAAQLARTGGAGDMSAELFANPGSADNWLYRLDTMDRAAGTADELYEQAQRDANSAQALQDQAAVAREALLELKNAADAAYEAAVEAATAAEAALAKEQEYRVELETQLAVLVEDRQATEEDYQAGQAHRAWLAEQERQRILKAEREAAALREAQNRAPGSRGGGGGSASAGGGGAATVPAGPSSSGWQAPHFGRITSGYGGRYDPLRPWMYKLHAGTDIASGCGTPIYAPAAGTVTFRGRDLYGANMLYINHGGGVQSEFFHFMAPAVVRPGQQVQAGQVVGYEGQTGYVTGCHLHFQMRVGGSLVNPQTFLANRGAGLG